MKDDLAGLFAFHRWADERVLAACRLLTPEQYVEVEPFEVGWPTLRSVVVHLAWANDAWIRRFLKRNPVPLAKETDFPTLDDAATLLLSCHDRFVGEVLPSLTPESLAAPFTFKNYLGKEFTAPLWAALRHVVNHGSYHRGQIASKLKRKGVDPPVTDLIYWSIENTPPAT